MEAQMMPTPVPSPGRSGSPWRLRLAVAVLGFLAASAATGFAIRLAPFHVVNQWGVLIHTVLGLGFLVPTLLYLVRHWRAYRVQSVSDALLLGYLCLAFLLACLISGAIVTAQALWTTRTSAAWRDFHLLTTVGLLAAGGAHLALSYWRIRREQEVRNARMGLFHAAGLAAVAWLAVGLAAMVHGGRQPVNRLPDDYRYLYGANRPFAPSLARTSTGGAIDSQSLAGSESCGTTMCHEQIVREWAPSAHRYAAMDTVFLAIQEVMAKQNGPESTRYCAGCHDPISLFSGTKNIFVDNLTSLTGYQEGISCLVCHAIQKTDVRGNANYTIAQPREYLWQWQTQGARRIARDFLIRAYPREHNRLSKRMFKTPEFCAACHKQFIDQEVNRAGWVQLQNQYDNWAASHWFTKGNPRKTVECRECHMPLAPSRDPAAGDSADYNRNAGDSQHRSHRFLAANNFMPAVLNLPGADEHIRATEAWLRGELPVPEIREKWADGPIVQIAIEAPAAVRSGDQASIRVRMTSHKVGHDFPTGPLDMIQSWVHITVLDDRGNTVFESGRRDADNFIEPGSFLFKAEPVDQFGNLIDRHNLWEMVGVRYRRSLFPGYEDFVEYTVDCPSGSPAKRRSGGQDSFQFTAPGAATSRSLVVTARLLYRKIDQFLLNYVEGKKSARTAPVVEIARAEHSIEVRPE
ncbi:MAG: hypothetical protein IPJ98_20380 [Bryobacterales bacterium]|nr:hypothetical protein [Bryobacterales bacterium]